MKHPVTYWLVVLMVVVSPAWAAQNTVTYQGVLADGGEPFTGLSNMSFSLWNDASAGSMVWGTESQNAVSVNHGLFSVQLGSVAPFGTVFQTSPQLWLEVTADTGSGPQAFAPRVPFSAAPYALHAINADTVDGAHAAALEESAEIDADIAAHNISAAAHANLRNGILTDVQNQIDLDLGAHIADTSAHPFMQINANNISSGKVNNARLNTGPGGNLDADTVDGAHAAALEESAEIDADIATHNTDAAAHADIRSKIDNDLAAHNASGTAHADIRTEIDTDIATHNTDAAAHANLNVNGGQIVTGTVPFPRLPTGTGGSQVAIGDHKHVAGDVLNGIFDIARIPTGATGTTVALGNHVHNSLNGASGGPANAVFVDSAGKVGVGTTGPGKTLEVNGTLGFTGNGATGETTGVISRAPRVIHAADPGSGCPQSYPINTALWNVPFTLTRAAAVEIHSNIIGNAVGDNHFLDLYVDGGLVQRTLNGHGPTGGWEGYSLHWSGVLAAGAHSTFLLSPDVTTWGCGAAHGAIDIVIFE